jgi:hypothetical protein
LISDLALHSVTYTASGLNCESVIKHYYPGIQDKPGLERLKGIQEDVAGMDEEKNNIFLLRGAKGTPYLYIAIFTSL